MALERTNALALVPSTNGKTALATGPSVIILGVRWSLNQGASLECDVFTACWPDNGSVTGCSVGTIRRARYNLRLYESVSLYDLRKKNGN